MPRYHFNYGSLGGEEFARAIQPGVKNLIKGFSIDDDDEREKAIAAETRRLQLEAAKSGAWEGYTPGGSGSNPNVAQNYPDALTPQGFEAYRSGGLSSVQSLQGISDVEKHKRYIDEMTKKETMLGQQVERKIKAVDASDKWFEKAFKDREEGNASPEMFMGQIQTAMDMSATGGRDLNQYNLDVSNFAKLSDLKSTLKNADSTELANAYKSFLSSEKQEDKIENAVVLGKVLGAYQQKYKPPQGSYKFIEDALEKFNAVKFAQPEKDADVGKRKGFETLYPQYVGKIGTPEYANAFRDYINKTSEKLAISISGAEARGRSFNDERFYSVFDTQLGQTKRIKGKFLNNDSENRYLDPQDPNLKSDSGSLTKITKGMDSVNAFEKGASQALTFSLSVAKDFDLGKYPKVNKVSQLFQYNLGDPKVKGLKNAITTAATEYMKVINAGSDLTAAELSVMGQQRAKEIIESSDNFDSLKNSIKIMQREMQISGNKFKAQRTEIRNRLKGYNSESNNQGNLENKKRLTDSTSTVVKSNRKPLSAY